MTATPVVMGVPTNEKRGEFHRVTADVDGSPTWFESADVSLAARPEVWGSAFLVPCLHVGRDLRIPLPVDETWLKGVRRMLPIYRRWWNTPDSPPAVAGIEPARAGPPSRPTGTFFTAGVDSFHALLRSGQPVGVLVQVQGYDIDLGDPWRLENVEAATRDVARALGLRSIVIRTNLRDHPIMRAVNWELTHGGALAAVVHTLENELGRMLVGSSFTVASTRGWGSHWMTDMHWSSSTTTIDHVGAELDRWDKTRQIAEEPLVQRHLHVCYENVPNLINCSRCQKCLFTMLCLAECGVLDRCETFHERDRLLERIDAIPAIRWRRKTLRRLALSGRLGPRLRLALGRLWLRSHARDSLPWRAWRSLRARWTGGAG